MTRRVATTGLVAVAALSLVGPTFASARRAAGRTPAARTVAVSPANTLTGRLIPATQGEVIPRHGGTVTSYNWSGYAVNTTSANITAVSSSFVVPASGRFPSGFGATWAGIGGYNTPDLIQAGTAERSSRSSLILGPQYSAWYELLPASETPLTDCSGNASCTVTPGDQVTVTITNTSGDTWTISMVDAGKWSWSKVVTYASSNSSAEWILEAPTVLVQTRLAPVGTVAFGTTSTYTEGGVTYTIAQGNPTRIDLTGPFGILTDAAPSPLAADGQSFNDCAYRFFTACPTP